MKHVTIKRVGVLFIITCGTRVVEIETMPWIARWIAAEMLTGIIDPRLGVHFTDTV
jgi:hypothetical protein